MSTPSDAVHARAEAVAKIEQAVRSYAEQERQVTTNAHLQMKQKVAQVQAEVELRRQTLERARGTTRQAEAALARCRENCGGLARAVANARRLQAQAEQSLGRARQAAQIVEQASSALHTATRIAERSIDTHAHAAVNACRELVDRMKTYLAVTQIVVSVSAAAEGLVQAGLVPPNRFIAPPPDQTSIVEIVEDSTLDQQNLWRDSEELRLTRNAGKWGSRPEQTDRKEQEDKND
jgi:hypothetical protein